LIFGSVSFVCFHVGNEVVVEVEGEAGLSLVQLASRRGGMTGPPPGAHRVSWVLSVGVYRGFMLNLQDNLAFRGQGFLMLGSCALEIGNDGAVFVLSCSQN